MNIFGIVSVIVYIIAFLFMSYCGKYLMETSYADICSVISLILLLTGAVLASMQKIELQNPAMSKKWEAELDQLQEELEERKRQLETMESEIH